MPVDPTRVARSDTGFGMPTGKVGVNANRDIQVTDGDTIPADATAVFANIEVRNATADGIIQLGPGGTDISNYPAAMNYSSNGVYTTGMTIKLNSAGQLRLKNAGGGSGSAVDVKVDIQGYFSGSAGQGGSFTPLTPANIYSTGWESQTQLGAGETRDVLLAGVAGVPSARTAGAVSLGVTARNWSSGGTITLWNADSEANPGTTNVAFSATNGVPSNGVSSSAIVDVSREGRISIHNSSAGPVDVTLVAHGWFSPPPDNSDLEVDGELTAVPQLIESASGSATRTFSVSLPVGHTLQFDHTKGRPAVKNAAGTTVGWYMPGAVDGAEETELEIPSQLSVSAGKIVQTTTLPSGVTFPVVVFPVYISVEMANEEGL